MNRVLLLLGIALVAAAVRTMWKKPLRRQRKFDLRDRVNTWENEGGQVPGVPPPRSGR
jgi:hypothetical protein